MAAYVANASWASRESDKQAGIRRRDMTEIELDARKIVRQMTAEVRIKNWREFQFRMWVAARLIILAARIGGFGITIDEIEE